MIALLQYISQYGDKDLPTKITFEEYTRVKESIKNNTNEYSDWYKGLIGFCGSFGSKWLGGYARNKKGDNSGKRTISAIKNLIKQAPSLKNINFKCCDFQSVQPHNAVIVCDPPYREATKYGKENFPYEEFYDYCRKLSKDNIVIICEYNMPNDFECIWSKETIVNFDSNRETNKNDKKRIEKLWMYKGE